MKIFCCKCKSSPSGASFVDWSTSWRLLPHHHHHHHLPHQRRLEFMVWALPLACAKLGGGAPVSYPHHFLCLYLS
jgi:hypothetical protein